GLEIEGGNNNVRVWGNYVNNTGTGISSTLTSVGPVYIFRNVWNRNQFIEGAANDSDQRQPMFKSGSSSSFANGRRYLFHNTMLQAQCSGCQYGMGGGAGIGGTGSTQLVQNTISMNNIYHLWKPNGAFYQIGNDVTFQNDLTNAVSTPEVGGIVATPQYAAGNGWQSESGGMYQLAAGTPGYDQGVRIANFNDGFLGAAPDVGAAEAGSPAMKFGVAAATAGTSAGGAGTTTTTGGTGGTGTGAGTGTGSTGSTGSATPSSGMDSSAYTIAAGQGVTFTASVYGNSGTPTGSMNFTSDTLPINGCTGVPVSGGKAYCTTSSLAGGSHAIRGIYSGDSVYGSGVAGPITQTVTGSTGTVPAPATTSTGTLSALSTRMQVLTGNDVLIGGFIIGGSSPKTVVVRARGPSLAAQGIANPLANPTLQLVRASDNATLAVNDDWGTAANASQISASGFAPGDSRESAVMLSLAPGAYTAIVSGSGGMTGVGIVEVYEVDHPEVPVTGISTRGQVLASNDVMIGGFVISGSSPKTVIVRARGPSLASQGVAGALSDPTLQLIRASDNATVAVNDDWASAPNASQISASGYAPSDSRESAILVTLAPGAYTAIVSGSGGQSGVGIVEVFSAP
ncbi:MAG TPA: Ig-like domain-containing protein, partial [Usitatibacter sp.]|nr:Ig-like domain-containing protein [Usitatibacter sp.]